MGLAVMPPGSSSACATALASAPRHSLRSWRTRASKCSGSRRGVRLRTATPNPSCWPTAGLRRATPAPGACRV